MNYKGGKIIKECIICGSVFSIYPGGKKRYCSKSCAYSDREAFLKRVIKRKESGSYNFSNEHRQKISKAHIGYKHTKETIAKFIGRKPWNKIEDRTKLKRTDRRNDSLYKEWRNNVYKRDRYKCRIDNNDCNGRIEAHHILSWSEFPKLRYDINNGITLCKYHHPRKKFDCNRLINKFKELIVWQQ